MYVNDNIVCKEIVIDLPKEVEAIAIEINLRSEKWLVLGAYKPPTLNKTFFIESICNSVIKLNYEHCILMGDFNLQEDELNPI